MTQETILAIRDHHRRRRFGMEQRKRADLALGAFLRTQLGWSAGLPAAQRKEIQARAAAWIKEGELFARQCAKRGLHWTQANMLPPELGEYSEIIMASIEARAPFNRIEKSAEAEMVRLVKSLPIWPRCELIKGFGAVGLAIIIAECATSEGSSLSDYATKSKVWKRLGLAVFDGAAQGQIKKGISGEARKEAWIKRGYSPARRSRIWTVGAALIKNNGEGKYRTVYLARKQYERQRAEAVGLTVAPASKIPKGRSAEFMSLMHIDRRAQRYMEKMLIRDLWKAWNQRLSV